MSNIIYIHDRIGPWYPEARGGKTFATEELEAWFFAALKIGDTYEKKLGVAKCSSEENYCKKIGREFAKERMKTTTFIVFRINESEDKREVYVSTRSNTFVLVKYKKANSVFFTEVYE